MDDPSVLLDKNNGFSIHVGEGLEEDDDAEALADQRNDELNDLIQDRIGGLLLSSDEDEENDDIGNPLHVTATKQRLGDVTSQKDFGDQLHHKILNGKLATSTPFAPSQRPSPLLQQTLSPWNKSGDKVPRYRHDQRPPGVEDFDKDHIVENGHRGNETRSPYETPPRNSGVRRGIGPSYEAVKKMDRLTGMGDGYGMRAGQDAFSPEEVQMQNITEAQGRQIKQLQEEMRDNCAALEGELMSYKDHMAKLTKQNGELSDALGKNELELQGCQQDLTETKSQLKFCRMDLDQIKEEKQDLLKKNYVNEGTIKQLRGELKDMTTWHTISDMKTQHEEMVVQLKKMHEEEMEKMRAKATRDAFKQDQITEATKKELEAARREIDRMKDQMKECDGYKAFLQESIENLERNLSEKNSELRFDRHQDNQTTKLLESQLRLKTEEISHFNKLILEMEEKSDKQTEELAKVRSELSRVCQENIRLCDDQTQALESSVQLRDQLSALTEEHQKIKLEHSKSSDEISKLTLADRTKQTEIANLKNTISKVHESLKEAQGAKSAAEQALSSAKSVTEKLEKELGDLKKQVKEGEIAKMDIERSNASVQRDWVKAQKDILSLREDLKVAEDAKHTADQLVASTQRDCARLQKELVNAQQQMADKTVSSALQQTIDLLQTQLKSKENDMTQASSKFREVEDRLYNQLRDAADENMELRDEKTRLHAEIHGMKKVLKKLKKYISANPSPSGDSGISEMKNDLAMRLAMAGGGEMVLPRETSDANLKELDSVRDSVIRIITEYRSDMEQRFNIQLDAERKKIATQIDMIYSQKLQQVLGKTRLNHSFSSDRKT